MTLPDPATGNVPAPPAPTPTPSQLRAELEELIVRDLMGPIWGEDERIPGDEKVRDWYALGMLAPRNTVGTDRERDNSAEGTGGEEESGDDEPEERIAAKMLLPSSFGLSFALAPGTERVRVIASWGQYWKITDEEKLDKDGKPSRWWQREPISAGFDLVIKDGLIDPVAPVPDFPDVLVRGTCVDRQYARYVTLFLVNDQERPSSNQNVDQVWLFQPQLAVEGADGASPFIGRKEALPGARMTRPPEEATLELLYRDSIEFATGHGVSVHAIPSDSQRGRARRVETAIVPRAEVARTEAPDKRDIAALADVELDMKVLAGLDDASLVQALRPLADAYDAWLDLQQKRVDDKEEGLEEHIGATAIALSAARTAARRLRTGIELLGADPIAAEAFRFANEAMWRQRVQTIAGAERRDKERALEAARAVRPREGEQPPLLPEVPRLADAVGRATSQTTIVGGRSRWRSSF
ncbi:MAG: hypothetical protein R3B97_01990 [Dehalococcoidia bacterium]